MIRRRSIQLGILHVSFAYGTNQLDPSLLSGKFHERLIEIYIKPQIQIDQFECDQIISETESQIMHEVKKIVKAHWSLYQHFTFSYRISSRLYKMTENIWNKPRYVIVCKCATHIIANKNN